MLIFRTFLLISCFIHCLCGDESVSYRRTTCQHSPESECVIDAVFRNIGALHSSVEVLVNCSNHDVLSANQFSEIDEIEWNGCHTPKDLKALGLNKIPRKARLKTLKIEKFSVDVLSDSEMFDGFIGLETLVITNNDIKKVTLLCFRGLLRLKTLMMIENNLKYLDGEFNLPMLKALEIHESQHLLMGNHQFRKNQTLDVILRIYDMETDLLEHLFVHARNLSISLNDELQGCHQSKLNGYRKDWIVESLKLENLKCGFIMENVESIVHLELNRAVEMEHSEFHLRELPNLVTLRLHDNLLGNFSSLKLFENLSSLEVLDLSDNIMTEIDMRMLEIFTSLKEINLERNFLAKLSEMNLRLFENVKFFVNGNSFGCSWLESIASSKAFSNFIYDNSFKSLNVNGLSCQQNNQEHTDSFTINKTRCASHFIDPAVKIEAQRDLTKLKENNFILEPEVLMIIVWVAFLLGLAIALLSIYLYRKRQILKQAPFYHLLRDSLARPIADVQITLRRDFKEIISRNLPPTNYEHPISDSNVTEMTDVAANTSNIYEEIPAKLYQEFM